MAKGKVISTSKKIKKSFITPNTKKKASSDGIEFDLDAIEQFNADREAVETNNVGGNESENEEETLALEGLSDEDDYDWDGEGEEDGDGEGEEDGNEEGEGDDYEDDDDIPEYDFDEEEYDRQERARQRDEEDADIIGKRKDVVDRPFAERLTAKEVYANKFDKGDDVEEAKRLQQEHRASQALEDFEFDEPTPVVKKAQKSKEEKMLDSFNADLDNIDLGKTEVETVSKKISKEEKDEALKEKLARIKEESPELINLLKDFKEKVHEVHNVILPVVEKAKKNELPTSEGISFLEVKNQLLLSYCINISFYLMLKAQGKKVKDHPVVDQLVRIRAILEKAKPIEKKLSYQINKLVRTANLGTVAAEDQDLSEKPNPAALEVDSEEEEVDQLGLYRAPKTTFEEVMETTETKEEKRLKREKQRLKHSRMADLLREEYGDTPEESTPGLASETFELTHYERELEKLEEANFRRKEITRAEKRRLQKRLEAQNDVLAGRVDFGDIEIYDDDNEKKKDEAFLAQKRMRAHMDLIDNRKRALKHGPDGDEDSFVQQPKKPRVQGRGGLLFDEEIESEEEEREERRPKFEAGAVPSAEPEIDEGTKRKANKKIEQNRGLVRPRNKEIKTPHARQRVRYEKRIAKMGGAHKIRSQDKLYSGEKRVRTNVTKSKKYAD